MAGSLLRAVRQDDPVAGAHLRHPRVVHAKVAALCGRFNDHFPGVDVVSFAGEDHFSILAYRRPDLHETHIGIRRLEQLELLLHAADLVLDFLVASQLAELGRGPGALEIASNDLYSLFAAVLRETLGRDLWVLPAGVFGWEHAAQK